MPRAVRPVLVLLGAWLVACELRGLGVHGMPTGPEKWLHLAMMGIGAALCFARAAIRREERLAWTLFGLGILSWTLGELYFTAVLWNDSSPPVPSLADAGYLLLPPFVFAGAVSLARSRVRRLPRMLLVDGAIAGLAVGSLSAAIVFAPVLDSLNGLSISVVTNLTYPVFDFIMLGLICGLLAMAGWRLDARLGVIALGVLCFWTADTVYLIKDAHGTWVSGGPFDPGWWTIAESLAIAAWMPAGTRRVTGEIRATIRTPVTFALVALAVLIAGSFTRVTIPAVVLASTALLTVIVRLVLTFRAHQSMLDVSRGEANTDPLTGLGNRRALALALRERVEDREQPTLLALFDLNGFKNYNDSFGHGAGDALLIRLAAGLQTVLAPPSAAFRMGGDEFCALLPGGNVGRALLHAATAVLSEHGDGFHITTSVGSVALPEEAADATAALRLADQRMYADKGDSRRAGAAQEVKGALLSALAQRDPELLTHLDDVGRLTGATARELGYGPTEVEQILLAAELHDIGKVAIPEAILEKPGPLSHGEWTLMRQHTVIGERILAASPALTPVGGLVRSSHERVDGRGYPDGLAGAEIPLGARIIAVCDSFDAMTSDRTYRKAMSAEVALAELREGAGTQFDPEVVSAFLRVSADAPGAAAAMPAQAPEGP